MITNNMSISDISDAGKKNTGDITRILDSFYLKTYDDDEHVSRMCRTMGFWEPDVTSWMTKNIKEGWNCFDVGSNIGYFTEVLCRLVKSSGSVYAFEPNKKIITDYKAVRKINNYDNCGSVKLFNFGVSDKNEEAVLSVPKINIGGASVFDFPENIEIEHKETIQLKRLDDLELIHKKIDFIKMDIEGLEPKAFAGMKNILSLCPLLVVELGPYHPKEFLEEVQETYNMYRIYGDSETEISINDIINAPHHWNVVLRKRI